MIPSLLVLALAAAPSDTAGILRSLEASGRALKTLKADFDETRVTLLLNEKEESKGVLFLHVPGKLRWDYTEPEPKVLLIKDGHFARYFPKSRQVFRGVAKGEADLLVGFGPGARNLGKKYQVTLAGEENVGTAAAAQVLDLTPLKGKEGLFAEIRLWVDKGRAIPIQTRLTEPTGDYTTIRFENVVTNGPLPKGAFDLKLPKGVVEVK